MNTIPLVRIVDDDPAIRKSLSFLLEMEGFAVQTFKSGLDFSTKDIPSQIGCVILDVKMPVVSGTSLFRELMARNYPNVNSIFGISTNG